MAQERKRRGRRAHLDDFQRSVSGEYIYTGKTHPFPAGGMTRRMFLARLWTLAGVMLAGGILAGCLPAAGVGDTPYVILPYVGSLLSAVSVVWLMCRLTGGGDPLPNYIYQKTVGQFALRGILTLTFSCAALAGEVLYLALHGPGDRLPGTLGFLLCQAAVAASALGWRWMTRRINW